MLAELLCKGIFGEICILASSSYQTKSYLVNKEETNMQKYLMDKKLEKIV